MRRWSLGIILTVLLCSLAFAACAQAAAALPPEVALLCEAAYPDHEVAAYSGWENDGQGQYALVLSRDSRHLLCMAEKGIKDTGYRLTMANDKALRSGEQLPGLSMTAGSNDIFYQYDDGQYHYAYHTQKNNDGIWGDVSLIREDVYNYEKLTVTLKDDLLVISNERTNGQSNRTSRYQITPVPAPWLIDSLSLERFDITKFPTDAQEALALGGMQAAADLLLPQGVTALDGCTTPAALFLLGSGQDGQRRLYLCQWSEGSGFRVTQSSPMPEGAYIDTVHAWSGIAVEWGEVGKERAYSFMPRLDGRWTAGYVMAEDWFGIGENFVATPQADQTCYGTFPAIDIRTVMWEELPQTYAQAVSMLDTTGWARVVSDDPQKRLHLRAAPDKDAKSLGKYYSGTAVRVLEDQGEWAHVSVYGIEGYMMKEFLAFGADMPGVPAYHPSRTIREDLWAAGGIKVYARPDEHADVTSIENEAGAYDVVIIGIVDDEWFHVLFNGIGVTGYVKQDSFSPEHG